MNRTQTITVWTGAAALLMVLTINMAHAGSVTVPNNFTAGTQAVAAEVNDNFSAVKTAVDDNDSRIAALEARIVALEEKLASVSTLTYNGQPTVRFTGVNVQVVNGQGSTATANGLGNLIVGYDEADSSGTGHCTIGWYAAASVPTNVSNCSTAGGTWTTTGFKTGSHYLVTGSQNNYSRWSGLLSGYRNTVNADYANVSGGSYNAASGYYTSISGGDHNTASGLISSVSGGYSNTASGLYSIISGGAGGIASGNYSSVSGGYLSTASGYSASISGGYYNTASGTYTSVNGGGNGTVAGGNTAATNYSSILGGIGQTTTTVSQTIPALP